MLILAAKYTFLFWFLVSSSNGDTVLLQHMEAEDNFSIFACTANCVLYKKQEQRHEKTQQPHQEQQQQHQQQRYTTHQQQEQHKQEQNKHREQQQEHRRHRQGQQQHHQHHNLGPLHSCFESCKADAARIKNVRRIYENLSMNLICRDDKSLTFRIDVDDADRRSFNKTETQQKPIPPKRSSNKGSASEQGNSGASSSTGIIYVIKIYNAEQFFVYLSDENFFTIGDLKSNSVYNVTAMAFHATGTYSVIAKQEQFITLQRGYKPGNVSDIRVNEFITDDMNDMRLMAKITWTPAPDMTCHYNIICFSPEIAEYDMTPMEIRNPKDLYSHHLENLTFSSTYKVGVRAMNSNNAAKESELIWKIFTVPSCVEWYNYNFTICAPLQPKDMEVEQKFKGGNEYVMDIRWQQPDHNPDYYSLRILDLSENGESYLMNVSKEMNSVHIPSIIIRGIMYEVQLTAYTPGGNSTARVTDFTNIVSVSGVDENHIVKLFIAIFAPIFCIIILSLTIFIICHRRAKLKRYQERCKYFEELEKKAPIDPKATFNFPTKNLPLLTSPEDLQQFQLDLEEKIFFNDAMEIDRNDVVLHEVLGEGAFGLVRRGIYNDEKSGQREVAVKMLKDQPSTDDIRAFRREIEVMKSVERHTNIVGIIGHCTKRCHELMLLTEYCSLGNLLDFLRNEWNYLHELHIRSTTQNLKQLTNNNNNNNNNTFNFDSKIIDKIKIKYKYFNANQMEQTAINNTANTASKGDDNTTRILVHERGQSHARSSGSGSSCSSNSGNGGGGSSGSMTNAADNKSYGYDEICTSACKCQVDVITTHIGNADTDANIDADQVKCILSQQQQHQELDQSKLSTAMPTNRTRTIAVKNCQCREMRQQQQQQQQHQQKTKQLMVENRAYFKNIPDIPPLDAAQRQRKRKDTKRDNANTTNAALSNAVKREPLSAADLLDIARQVAVGMEFLAKNKVVHRDLAARNVLVSTDRTIKIADFGLSRDIYQENIYKKTGNGKLPIKWLAIESMTHQVYTTQSDVWSYGILLYEIVTLGGTPYPSIPTNRLLSLLKSGFRMERPKGCGEELYNLMHSCWHANPSDRPTFTSIIRILECMLSDEPERHIENIFVSVPKESRLSIKSDEETSTMSDDPYLKPLK